MQARVRGRALVTSGVLTVLCTAGCTAEENIAVTNDADEAVTVQLGDEGLEDITPDGGVVILGTTECYEGPIVVTYAQGSVVELEGPICPGQTLAVTAAAAEIVDGTGTDGVRSADPESR